MTYPFRLLTAVIGGCSRDKNERDAKTGAELGRNQRVLRARQPRASPTTKIEGRNEASRVPTGPCLGLLEHDFKPPKIPRSNTF